MIFDSYGCPNCETYFREIKGCRTQDGQISIQCPACYYVDRFKRGNAMIL